MPKRGLYSFTTADGGATAIEYSLIAALIAVFVIAAIAATGNATGRMFDGVADRAGTALTSNTD